MEIFPAHKNIFLKVTENKLIVWFFADSEHVNTLLPSSKFIYVL